MAGALLDGLARDLLDGAVVPWLGPEVHAAPPFPAGPAALAAFIAARAPVPGRIRGNLGAAAQYVEQHSHRRTLERIMREAFSPAPLDGLGASGRGDGLGVSGSLLGLLAGLPRLPLVVDAWYDATCARHLQESRGGVALLHGVDRTGQGERFFACATAPGLRAPDVAFATGATVVYQPLGTCWPDPSFVVSDADWVEVLTEIDIQTPIPPAVQRLRDGRRFLFLGQRFSTQLERLLARQVSKRSAPGGVAVLPGALSRNEERFLARARIARLALPLEVVVTELARRLEGAVAGPRAAGVPA